ncbi:hypothetical protein EDD21DRAFT_367044 [Dissophora ornata]|nr:hypothetical protein EDD21DRAFT_367044 [Dissophora ornata]
MLIGTLGLVPFMGDMITMFLALQLVYTAQQADIPKSLTQRMFLNVAFDFIIGLTPILGDFADFLFKANDKNAKLFEAFLFERAAAQAAEAEAAAASNRVAAPPAVANPAGDSGAGKPLHHNNTTAPKASKSFFGRSRRQQEQEQHYQAQPYNNQHTTIEMEPVGVHPPVK